MQYPVYLDESGNGIDSACVLQNGLCQCATAQANCPGSVALEPDDFVRRLDDLRVDFGPVFRISCSSSRWIDIAESDSGDVDTRPDRDAGITVLADNPSVSGGRCNVKALRQQETETRRVQIGSRTNNALLGQTAHFPGHVRQQVNCRSKPTGKNPGSENFKKIRFTRI